MRKEAEGSSCTQRMGDDETEISRFEVWKEVFGDGTEVVVGSNPRYMPDKIGSGYKVA